MLMKICPRGIESYEVEVDYELATPTSVEEDSITVLYKGVDISGFIQDDKMNELKEEINQFLWDRRDRSR